MVVGPTTTGDSESCTEVIVAAVKVSPALVSAKLSVPE